MKYIAIAAVAALTITACGTATEAPTSVERPGSFGEAFAEACVEENGSAMSADCEVVGDAIDHMKDDLDRATYGN